MRRLLPWFAALALLAGIARAQELESESADGLGDDAEARAAYSLVKDGKMLNAREAAEELLKHKPKSYAGRYILGYVLHRNEGNLAQAFYQMKEARRIFEKQFGAKPDTEKPWLWHVLILQELAALAGEMGMQEERIAFIEAYNEAYDPKWPAEPAWPLMRLRRYDEARKVVADGLASDQPDQISSARTTLCAIESELLRRQESYEACRDAARYDQETNQAGAHTFTNAGGAALGLLKFDEAESMILEGTKYFQEGATSNPWEDLLWLYLGEGRFPEARDTVREMFAWQAAQPPYMDEQARAEIGFASGMFLLATGHAEEATRVIDRFVDRPDRTGFTSVQTEQLEAANSMLSRVADLMLAERKLEEASWSGWWDWAAARLEARRLRAKAWESGRRAAALLLKTDNQMLISTIRPYLAGSVALPEWLEGELCAVLGPGVIAAALKTARSQETLEGAGAYFDAFDAESLWLNGAFDEALPKSRRALEALPQSEVLLRARVAAIGAQSALEQGESTQALALFEMAMQLDPGVIRRLGLALPCSMSASGSPIADRALKLLGGSPRWIEAEEGFLVQIQGTENSGQACLLGLAGEVLACANVTGRAGEDSDGIARRLAEELHEQAFAARVDLTQADLQSLDGMTTTSHGRNALRIKEIFGSLSEEDPQ